MFVAPDPFEKQDADDTDTLSALTNVTSAPCGCVESNARVSGADT
nr:hypothetical protein [Burkholderia ambifaria]